MLETAINSALAQTCPPDEIVIVDDGSTDDTRSVVESLANELGHSGIRIHYLFQRNQGKCAAVNNGLRSVTSDWVAFLDSDDRWLPDKTERQMEALAEFPECGACFTDACFLNNPNFKMTAFERAGRRYSASKGYVQNSHHLFLRTDWPGIHMPTVIVRRDLIESIGGLDLNLPLEHDADLVFRLGQITKFCYVNLPLAEFDRTENRAFGLVTQFPIGGIARLLEKEKAYRKWCTMVQGRDPRLYAAIKECLRSTQHTIFRNLFLQQHNGKMPRDVLVRGFREHWDPRFPVKWLLSYLAPGFLRSLLLRRRAGVPASQQ